MTCDIKKKVIDEIKRIEEQHQVKVLFAVESGSRSWGFPSMDSDYDVRFIYVHQKDWYLSIDEKRDVIELPINNYLDMNGWEIRKALKLFRKSNPPLLEWINANIIYYDAFSFMGKMRTIKDHAFKPDACMHHYLNMAKRNYREYLQKEQVKVKKYFYVLRPVLSCMWIEKYQTNPPVLFQTLLDDLLKEGDLKSEIEGLLDKKIAGKELNITNKVTVINDFIEDKLMKLTDFASSLNRGKEDINLELDQLFRDILEEVWG